MPDDVERHEIDALARRLQAGVQSRRVQAADEVRTAKEAEAAASDALSALERMVVRRMLRRGWWLRRQHVATATYASAALQRRRMTQSMAQLDGLAQALDRAVTVDTPSVSLTPPARHFLRRATSNRTPFIERVAAFLAFADESARQLRNVAEVPVSEVSVATEVAPPLVEARDGLPWTEKVVRVPQVPASGPTSRRDGAMLPLLVPPSLVEHVLNLGASWGRDHSGPGLFIPPAAAPAFDRLLPMAERRNRPKLAFSPIQTGARGQNLHEVFSAPDWDRLRRATYDRAGGRCELCGGRDAELWRWAREKTGNKQKGGRLDCHEVWDWRVADAEARTGVQTLRRLMAVCRDCHMMFHADTEVAQAIRLGGREHGEALASELLRRQAGINRNGLSEQIALLREEQGAYRAAGQAVDLWVMDLATLARLDGTALEMSSANPAGVTAEMVAGIPVLDEAGRLRNAVSVQDAVSGRARILGATLRP